MLVFSTLELQQGSGECWISQDSMLNQRAQHALAIPSRKYTERSFMHAMEGSSASQVLLLDLRRMCLPISHTKTPVYVSVSTLFNNLVAHRYHSFELKQAASNC